MSHYHHITSFERGRIEEMQSMGYSLRKMSQKLNRSISTLSRELNRCPEGTYHASDAQENYAAKRQFSHPSRMLSLNEELQQRISSWIIDFQWSPEQISGFLRTREDIKISHSTIYRGIYLNNLGVPYSKDKRGLARSLRHRGKTRRRKGSIERRGKIKIPRSIHDRPLTAQYRLEPGHWEIDTVWGKVGEPILVTMVDRCTRQLRAGLASSKRALDLNRTLTQLMTQIPKHELLSITPDRGKEFSKTSQLEELFNVPFYFPDAHAPWQRGTNENTNGLIREYLPKNQSLINITDNDIQDIVNKINTRPRKLFGWSSSDEFYLKRRST